MQMGTQLCEVDQKKLFCLWCTIWCIDLPLTFTLSESGTKEYKGTMMHNYIFCSLDTSG